jgi:hypothetical protein
MVERGFTEIDLRIMLEDAEHIARDVEPGRWAALARLDRRPWEIIVEPDPIKRRLVVVTAYELD